jgi:hypothetical protein
MEALTALGQDVRITVTPTRKRQGAWKWWWGESGCVKWAEASDFATVIGMEPISLLVDNAILSYGNVAETISVPVPNYGNRLLLIAAKPARSANEKWLQNQIESLPTIARLAREGRVSLNTYSELEFEFGRSKTSFPANIFGDVFQGVPISRVNAPIERSFFFQEDLSSYVQKESQTKFCRWLLCLSPGVNVGVLMQRVGGEQINNFKNLDRYREICRSLHPTHFVDAFHLWTGEVNRINYFLTADGRFVRALANDRTLQLDCRPIFPADLLDVLKVSERDPLPFQYGRRYTLNGLPYDK